MPLSAFAHALRAFHSGDLTRDELSWEIDRQLAVEKASPVALLEVLKLQQVAQPLPGDAHEAIVIHLQEWPRDPTVVTGLSRRQTAARSPSVGVGDILQGRFSLVALIGEGGMSRVFKAIDLRRVEAGAADPYVAVKVLTQPYGDYFGSILALQRETHKLQSLTHPNIVRVIDCDRDAQTVFMTMEYLAGESLQKKLRGTGTGTGVGVGTGTGAPVLDVAAALSLVTTVGTALEYAHRNHIVHGDLKPGNIIITDKGVVKVIDFGMARFIARADDGRLADPSQQTPKAVTPRYASPEMVAGHDPEPADDVYALACIAYEAMSGRHPFGRHSDPRARDPQARPPLPRGMRHQHYAALVKALAFDRRQRTPQVRLFLDQLLATRRAWTVSAWIWVPLLAFVLTIGGDSARSGAAPMAKARTVIQDCANCPSMTVLSPGRFEQGTAPARSAFESPRHQVIIGHAFAMSSHEVTVGEFREFAAATQRGMSGCAVYDGHWQYQPAASWQTPGFAQDDTHPVTCVSWDDAEAYAAWLGTKTGHVYRLPSASEWEYAARAGDGPEQPWGSAAAACAHGNLADQTAAQNFPGWSVFPCSDHYVNTAPVGSFRANAFGIYDLLGNVFEWVEDCWHDDYSGAPRDGSARRDGSCQEHEMRGGSWFTSPRYVAVSYRNRFDRAYRSTTTGVRLVRELADK